MRRHVTIGRHDRPTVICLLHSVSAQLIAEAELRARLAGAEAVVIIPEGAPVPSDDELAKLVIDARMLTHTEPIAINSDQHVQPERILHEANEMGRIHWEDKDDVDYRKPNEPFYRSLKKYRKRK